MRYFKPYVMSCQHFSTERDWRSDASLLQSLSVDASLLESLSVDASLLQSLSVEALLFQSLSVDASPTFYFREAIKLEKLITMDQPLVHFNEAVHNIPS